jgi:putative transposase
MMSHTIRLKPTRAQIPFLMQCCGVARFVYNWGLNEIKICSDNKEKWPTAFQLDKKLNSIKEENFPWMYDVPCCIGQQALSHLGSSLSRFYKKISDFPVFKKKGIKDSFTLTNQTARIDTDTKRLCLSKGVRIKMYQKLRFAGKIMSYTISRKADQWFVSILVEVEDPEQLPFNESQVGVDLGIKSFLTTSDTRVVENPKYLRNGLKKLRRLQKSVSRKVKGSNNRLKAKMRLAKQHLKVSNKRKDFLHNVTTQLIRTYGCIKIEDLNVKGMLRNHKLALSISDVGWSEFKRQLIYKANWYGRSIVEIPTFYPSSKMCSCCGKIKENLKLSDRTFVCDGCGPLDRDLNAAINIQNYTDIVSEFKPVESKGTKTKKQEISKELASD